MEDTANTAAEEQELIDVLIAISVWPALTAFLPGLLGY